MERTDWHLKGFTLIELLVVIAIIALLSTVVLASLNTARSRARDAERKSELRQIQTAIEIYRSDTGSFPPNKNPGAIYHDYNADFLSELISAGYLPAKPTDPQSPTRVYSYYFYGGACGYIIFSMPEGTSFKRSAPGCSASASLCGTTYDCIQGGQQ